MKIEVPELSLIILFGEPENINKISPYFKKTEVLSLEMCKGLIADDESNTIINQKAMAILDNIISLRLELGKLTVVNATNIKNLKGFIEIAKKYDVESIAIVLNQVQNAFLGCLKKEGFNLIHVVKSLDEFEIIKVPLACNLKHEHGPFDIIGDVHGCYQELITLLKKLGYVISDDFKVVHPDGRKIIFVGDLVDRGPEVVNVLKLVMTMVKDNIALCVPGNHDMKLLRKLKGHDVQITHGLEGTVKQLENQAIDEEIINFLENLVSHYVFDDGKLIVAHAGLKEQYHGRLSKRVFSFALYGETTNETDEYGLPVRNNWAKDYYGKALVVYGHTPQEEVLIINNTINIDTGCVFGGKLTAFRYPERILVDVKAYDKYYEPAHPFLLSTSL